MRAFAFLRGINVGNRRPKKDDLIAAVAGDGIEDVSTYQAAGNVAFATELPPSTLEPVLEQRLQAALGYEVVTLVRSLDELVALVDHLPALDDGEKHQVVLFRHPPDDATRAAYTAAAEPTDRLSWRDRELVWTHVGGLLDSGLSTVALAGDGPPQTVRTGGTIERLVAKFR